MWKRYLIAGLLIWVPLGITLWVLDFVVTTMDRSLLLLPPTWRPESWLGVHIPGFGVVLSVLVVLVTGILAANIIGQQLVRWWEGLLSRIPIVRPIYSSVKQVSDTLFSKSGNSFRRAVLVEFPQAGQWTVGFVVGAPGPRIAVHGRADAQTVYVPTAPNPTSGYVLIVAPEQIRDLDISVDEALKFVVSLGVVAPAISAAPALSAQATTGRSPGATAVG